MFIPEVKQVYASKSRRFTLDDDDEDEDEDDDDDT